MQGIIDLLKRHAHFVRFLVVGSFNTGLDFGLFFILANLISINRIIANLLSTGLTMCVSFFLNHRFVFRSTKSKRNTVTQFVGATLFNVWGVQSLIIFLVPNILRHLNYLSHHNWTINSVAKLCGIAVSFVLNFIMYRYIFHEKQSESGETEVL